MFFCGVKITSLLANASGCRCSNLKELLELDNNPNIGIIVTKTATWSPRSNPDVKEAIHDNYEKRQEMLNNIGLVNPGYLFYAHLRHKINKPMMISIFATSLYELTDMLTNLNNICTFPTFVEWNVSCPNVKHGMSWVKILPLLHAHLKTWTNIIIGAKLNYLMNVKSTVEILKKFPLAFITCGNTLPNGLMFHPKGLINITRGALSGIKSLNLGNVYDYSIMLKTSNIQIIGCGGISCAQDVQDYIACGANLVQVGTRYYQNPAIFSQL